MLSRELEFGEIPPLWDGRAAERIVNTLVESRLTRRRVTTGMLKIIFTLDYEIHGNGDGCPHELMVEPTDRMLRLIQ